MHPAAITAAALRVVNNAYLMQSNAVDCKFLITFLMMKDVELVRNTGADGGGRRVLQRTGLGGDG